MSATARGNKELQEKARAQLANAKDPLEKLRLQCLSRGASGIKGLGRTFRIIDDDGSKSLDISEFKKGCTDFGADLTKDEITTIYSMIDKDGSGTLDFDEFLMALRPPMSKARINLITLAFQKLDRTKDGAITVEDLKGVYNCKHHPKYKNGEWNEEQVFLQFLKQFETPNEADGRVTKDEFINYYSGVSASIDSDAYFDLMMRNAYGLFPIYLQRRQGFAESCSYATQAMNFTAKILSNLLNKESAMSSKDALDDADDPDDSFSSIIVGLCAMATKVTSKPMQEILHRLESFTYIHVIVFEEKMILNDSPETWPLCDVLISFYSYDFPLLKVIEYADLRKPHLINDLRSQYVLMDRLAVYRELGQMGIPVPRYAVVLRDSRGQLMPGIKLVEQDDCIEINGEVFHKPFVEKPQDAEDHNIYIYFPSTAGGGCQHLFRKKDNRSSKYFPDSRIRNDRSYLYEEFMPTDGTDVKVYTVGDDYAHAEARKSPALDGKVERDLEGKEVRYPVILTQREKITSKRVVQAFHQRICGFDLLRANGMSYVCDVNGFSFVKSSKKYYDDCGHILGMIISRLVTPHRSIAARTDPVLPEDDPLVPTTRGVKMELRCVIGVIRHGDRTPKEKMKMEVKNEAFFQLFRKCAGHRGTEVKLKKPAELQEVLDIVRVLLNDLEMGRPVDPEVQENANKYRQMRAVLQMYGHFSGFNRKVQMKYQPCSFRKPQQPEQPCILVIVKWGGELTAAGRQQAEDLGHAFRCIYPGGDGSYGKDPGLGLLRLHSTYRHDLKIYASDEGRVQMTAAAFTKGFLALEGELPPILIQMVKSANTNGLLDSDNDSCKYTRKVKEKIQAIMSKRSAFTEEDVQLLCPTRSNSLLASIKFIHSPHLMCDRICGFMRSLVNRFRAIKSKPQLHWDLYHAETWDLLLRRWSKLLKDFHKEDGEYDIAKISDIYDNIKYDIQHNPRILENTDYQELYVCVKAMADLVIPQEYGITVEEKLLITQRICKPLLRKILSDVRYTDVNDCTRLHTGYFTGAHSYSSQITSPDRFVRTRLYFTSESHVHSLLTCLIHGGLTNVADDEQWRRAMQYVSCVPEINYMAQIVFMIYEDPQKPLDAEDRFHVELHFSPGAYTLCRDSPLGSGYRPQNTEVEERSRQALSCDNKCSQTSKCPKCFPSLVSSELPDPSGPGCDLPKFTVTSFNELDSERPKSPVNINEPNMLKFPSPKTKPKSRSAGSLSLTECCQKANNYYTYPMRKSSLFGTETERSEWEALNHSPLRRKKPFPIVNFRYSPSTDKSLKPSCLISTAVIRGSMGYDGTRNTQKSSLDLTDLPINCYAQAMSTDTSPEGYEAPTALSVPEIYPLETLHNALTLRGLNNFLCSLTGSEELRALNTLSDGSLPMDPVSAVCNHSSPPAVSESGGTAGTSTNNTEDKILNKVREVFPDTTSNSEENNV